VSAFDSFIELQWEPLVRYTATFVGRVEDAKDIVQEGFVRLWEERAQIRPSGSIRSYLYRIVRNLAINERKRRDLHGRLKAREMDDLVPRSPTPVQALDAAELGEAVRVALDSLPDRRREAFMLAHFEDLPHREIAEIMEIAPQTVANQISAALGDLRRSLAPFMDEPAGARLQSG
jgi:RNA polymerase sigma-70 factor, ECF subfamily